MASRPKARGDDVGSAVVVSNGAIVWHFEHPLRASHASPSRSEGEVGASAGLVGGFGIGELIPVDAEDAATHVAETIDCGVGVDRFWDAVGLGSVG